MSREAATIAILIVVTFVYLSVGAVVFMKLESPHERSLWKKYDAIFHEFSREHNITEAIVQKFLDAHQEACELGVTKSTRWDFPGSFFFVWTILTTIGFGFHAPSTTIGRVFFMFYSTIGIPLTILLLNTGLELVLPLLVSALNKVRAFLPNCKAFRPIDEDNSSVAAVALVSGTLIAALVTLIGGYFSLLEDWSIVDSVYFVIVACLTVGFGDMVPSRDASTQSIDSIYKILNCLIIMIGVFAFHVQLNLVASAIKYCLDTRISKICSLKSQTEVIVIQDDTDKGPQTPGPDSRSRSSSASSPWSGRPKLSVGAFASIIKALEYINLQSSEVAAEDPMHIKAVAMIEGFLSEEYDKIMARRGNTPKARWHRAAHQLRLQQLNELSDCPYPTLLEEGSDQEEISHSSSSLKDPATTANSRTSVFYLSPDVRTPEVHSPAVDSRTEMVSGNALEDENPYRRQVDSTSLHLSSCGVFVDCDQGSSTPGSPAATTKLRKTGFSPPLFREQFNVRTFLKPSFKNCWSTEQLEQCTKNERHKLVSHNTRASSMEALGSPICNPETSPKARLLQHMHEGC